jgi:hypothetical protein
MSQFNLDVLISNQPVVTSQWAKNTVTKQFFLYLQEERNSLVGKISSSTEVNELLRLQGELRRLDKILDLPSVLERAADQKGPNGRK